jgi:NDP-sugar pyrophosphorylase family protein
MATTTSNGKRDEAASIIGSLGKLRSLPLDVSFARFETKKGIREFHRHRNPPPFANSPGCWVEDTSEVEGTVYGGPQCLVLGGSHLGGRVKINDRVTIMDSVLSDESLALHDSIVYMSKLTDKVAVLGFAVVKKSVLYDDVIVMDRARISGVTLDLGIFKGGYRIKSGSNGRIEGLLRGDIH